METQENPGVPQYTGTMGAAIAASPVEVRASRASQIVEATRLNYRRRIEDKVMTLKVLEAQRQAHLDLSPDNSQCLISAKNFDEHTFVSVRVNTCLAIKEAKEEVAVLVADYTELFGVAPSLDI